jgi:hypothetical protein
LPFANGLQVITKLCEREIKVRVVVYSITDVARHDPSLGGDAFYLKVKPPEGLID